MTLSSFATTPLTWESDHVQADVENVPLPKLLEQISHVTGWDVYMEPGTTITTSAKFKDLSETDALKRLLGNLSFSLTPQDNSVRKLYVFRTNVRQATQLVRSAPRKGGKIGNELVVAIRPGTSIEDLAKKLGAKIIGRADGLNTYRLQFDSEDAADKAKQLLRDDDDVTGVEPNFTMDAPAAPEAKTIAATSLPPFRLEVNPDPNHVVIGLIDTHMQALDPAMQKFVLPGFEAAGAWSGSPDDATHGTFMAQSILHGVQNELGPTAQGSSMRILPIDVYGNNTQTTTFDVANGIAIAMKNGASVINLSLGSSGDSAFLQQVITAGGQKGVIFIAAAGNTPVTSPTFPAAYNGVLAVTASDASGKLAYYANRGPFVDVIFPGTDIGKIGTTAYQVNGTSTSTAYASGVAAALMQRQTLSTTAAMTFMASKWSFRPVK
jgi:hypothetical protein